MAAAMEEEREAEQAARQGQQVLLLLPCPSSMTPKPLPSGHSWTAAKHNVHNDQLLLLGCATILDPLAHGQHLQSGLCMKYGFECKGE